MAASWFLATVPTADAPEPCEPLAAERSDEQAAAHWVAELKTEVADLLHQQPIEKPRHVLNFFRNATYKSGGGQQLSATCMFCKHKITSTGSTRLVEHLAGCIATSNFPEVKEPCQKLLGSRADTRKEKNENMKRTREEADRVLEVIKVQKQEMRQQGIRSGFRLAEIEAADRAIARFFYTNAISFNAVAGGDSCVFREMIRALQVVPVYSYVQQRHITQNLQQMSLYNCLSCPFAIVHRQCQAPISRLTPGS